MKKTNACVIALLNRGRPARDAPAAKPDVYDFVGRRRGATA